MKERVIRSADLYQDVAVEILIEEKSSLEADSGMVLFVRPATKAVLDAISAYHSGIAINALLFSQTLKRRRGEMLSRRNVGVAR